MQDQPSVIHSTFVLERSFSVPIERVFGAFAEPASKQRWLSEDGDHPIDSFAMDFRVGGVERLEYRLGDDTPFPGTPIVSLSIFQDIVEQARVVEARSMTLGGRRISAALVTFEFLSTTTGADLIVTHQGAFFEGSDGPEMRKDGWRKMMDSLETFLQSE